MLGVLPALVGAIVVILGLWMRVVLAMLDRHIEASGNKALQQLLDSIRDTGMHASVVKAQGFQGLRHFSLACQTCTCD